MVVFVPLFLIAAIALTIWHGARAQSMLENWAAVEGYRIVSCERRTFRRGPFFFTSGKGHEVYRITVEDQSGQIKSGYIRCGGFLFGLLSDRVDVRWDVEPTQRPGFPVVMKDCDRRDDVQ